MDLKRVRFGELQLTSNGEIGTVLGAYSERITEALCSDIPVDSETWLVMSALNDAYNRNRNKFKLAVEPDFETLLSYLRPFVDGTDKALRAIAESTAEPHDPEAILTRKFLGEVAADMLGQIETESQVNVFANDLEDLDLARYREL